MFQQNATFDCFWIVDVAKITLAQFWIFRSFTLKSQNKHEIQWKIERYRIKNQTAFLQKAEILLASYASAYSNQEPCKMVFPRKKKKQLFTEKIQEVIFLW